MSVAWTTIVIIALLLPGVLFFVGSATRERYTREIVKSNAIADVGLAIIIAIIIHMIAWGVLAAFGFDLAAYAKPLADYSTTPPWLLVDQVVSRLFGVAAYVVGTAITGLALGYCLAWTLMNGKLGFLATHKWFYQVMRSMKSGLVTAHVMTTTKEAGRVLMYKGVLTEFYLSPEGKFVYVVLKSCSRFYMKLDGDSPTTSAQAELFGKHEAPERSWDYLLIDGANIANILFDPSPEIVPSTQGSAALDKAFDAIVKELMATGKIVPPPN